MLFTTALLKTVQYIGEYKRNPHHYPPPLPPTPPPNWDGFRLQCGWAGGANWSRSYILAIKENLVGEGGQEFFYVNPPLPTNLFFNLAKTGSWRSYYEKF